MEVGRQGANPGAKKCKKGAKRVQIRRSYPRFLQVFAGICRLAIKEKGSPNGMRQQEMLRQINKHPTIRPMPRFQLDAKEKYERS